MKKIFTSILLLNCIIMEAQVSITNIAIPYTQDFNSLANSGTANTVLPTGWAMTTATYAADNGSISGGTTTYSLGTTGSTERSIGSVASNSTQPKFGVQFINNTGLSLTTITIAYTGEQWRLGTAARVDRLDFQYSTTATTISTGTWIDENTLDFTAPITAGTLGILDGNTAPNRTIISSSTITFSTPILNGSTFWIRWNDFNATGADDVLSTEDFSMSYTGVLGDPNPPAVTTLTPADNAINVATTSDLSILFNENIVKGIGNILVRQLSDDAIVQTLDVTSALITISGGNTANIDIAPLANNTAYYIEVAAGAFEDIAGNDFVGISGNTTWNFTTIPLPAAGIIGNNYSFASCASTFLTEGWRQFSVTGTQSWVCTASGRTGADGIEMNAFVSGGNNPLNEDWLLSPPFDLTSVTAPTLKFYSKGDFTPGNGLVVKVSTNYTSGTNPNTATWTDVLTFTTPSGSNTAWVLNDNIDLSTFNTTNVYIAWLYSNPTTANSSRWRIDDATVYSNIVLPPCDEPTDQPSNLVLTPTATTVSGTFTAAVPAPTGYLVVRSITSTLSANPIDGSTYTVGATLGGGTVIANSSSTSFTDNGLSSTTLYYYFVFAYNNENCTGGSNYNVVLNTPNGNTNSTTTLALAPCVEPSIPPTSLNLSATNTTISGTFTPSASANRYLVVITATPPISATPSDGITYTAGSAFGTGTVVSFSAATNFTATGLTANTPYSIYIFAANGDCTGEPDYFTSSLDGSINTTDGTGVPIGYYSAATGLTCQPLKTALKNIISTGTDVLSYTPGLWNLYPFSDKRRNDANTADIVWDTYTDIPTGPEVYTFTLGTNQCGNYTNEGDCYNREHSTPQSWFSSASPMVSDAHHIFPTDGKINALHSNFPYGEVQTLVSPSSFNPSTNGSKLGTSTTENYGYGGTVFEPIDEYKGDYARAFLYIAVRYEDEIISQNWSGRGLGNEVYISPVDSNDNDFRRHQIYDNWYIKLLNKWHIQDPVSAKEVDRNNVIYSQLVNDGGTPKRQGNRNPFVDHPEYVNAIWGPACLSVLPVTISNLSIKKVNNNTAVVSWRVSNEQSIISYVIERSVNGTSFEKISELPSNGNGLYSFTDGTLPKVQRVYYRIKTIEVSGKNTVTNIVSIDGNVTVAAIKIYPNPAVAFLTVELNNITANELNTISITDIAGKLILQKSFAANQSVLLIPVQYLSNGVYTLKVANTSTTINSKFVIAK